MEFKEFPKIARLSREAIITEKIDGTNASVFIDENGEFLTGSRTRWITPDCDNHGFSAWAHSHKDELMKLGPGHHFGEWWGSGIQRGYGLQKGEKRWSLFNVLRWADDRDREKCPQDRPVCCHVVPEIWRGPFDTPDIVRLCLNALIAEGSRASDGFMNPEGVVVYHIAGNVAFKKTILKDDEPKSITKA